MAIITRSPQTSLLDVDDFFHNSWLDYDTGNLKFIVLYHINTDWINWTIIWEAVFGFEDGWFKAELLEYENS